MTLDKKSSVQLTTGQLIPAFALVDDSGNQISDFNISAGIVTVTNIVNEVEIKNDSGNPIPVSDAGGSLTVDGPLTDMELRATAVPVSGTVNTLTGLEIPEHDYIGLTYTGDNLTGVAYKTGGSGGTTVATLTLAYTGSRLDSVTKS